MPEVACRAEESRMEVPILFGVDVGAVVEHMVGVDGEDEGAEPYGEVRGEVTGSRPVAYRVTHL